MPCLGFFKWLCSSTGSLKFMVNQRPRSVSYKAKLCVLIQENCPDCIIVNLEMDVLTESYTLGSL